MFGLNNAQIIGRLGADATISHLTNGGRVANVSIATDESYLDRNSGDKVDRTEWHRIVTFQDGLVEMMEKHARKNRTTAVALWPDLVKIFRRDCYPEAPAGGRRTRSALRDGSAASAAPCPGAPGPAGRPTPGRPPRTGRRAPPSTRPAPRRRPASGARSRGRNEPTSPRSGGRSTRSARSIPGTSPSVSPGRPRTRQNRGAYGTNRMQGSPCPREGERVACRRFYEAEEVKSGSRYRLLHGLVLSL